MGDRLSKMHFLHIAGEDFMKVDYELISQVLNTEYVIYDVYEVL